MNILSSSSIRDSLKRTEWDEKVIAAFSMVCLVHNYTVTARLGITGHLKQCRGCWRARGEGEQRMLTTASLGRKVKGGILGRLPVAQQGCLVKKMIKFCIKILCSSMDYVTLGRSRAVAVNYCHNNAV